MGDAGLSAVFDIDDIDPRLLPVQLAVSAITMAELAAGPQAAKDPVRAIRQDRLQSSMIDIVQV